MNKFTSAFAAVAVSAGLAGAAWAEDTIKIGEYEFDYLY